MAKASKKIEKLKDHHAWYDAKVKELEEERQNDRSFSHKSLLIKLKKTKLAIKDQINNMMKDFKSET
jgi:hypothetical protein